MGLIKYRSNVDYAQILAGAREGINLGIDGDLFVRKQLDKDTFINPRIGTQGESEGATGASTDISLGPDDSFDIAVDGGAVVSVTLTLAGLNTGALIEAALETAINSALAAGGQDARVWVNFDGAAPDQYTVYSQSTGTTSSVVITDAGANNVADDLGLGTANGGTETAGSDDQDYLLYTTGGANFSQPVESNNHRSSRFHTGVVKQKKVVDFDISANLNFSGSAGDSLDDAVRVLLESTYGTETINPGVSIDYTQGLPNFYFSVVKVSTIFAEYFTGMYVQGYTLTAPGDDQVTQQWTGRGIDAAEAGLAQLDGAVVASDSIIVNSTPDSHSKRYTVGAPVMFVDVDGRTITAGGDGSITVTAVDTATHTVTVSTTVDAANDSYMVPWHPGAVQTTARDNIQTDLEGSIKLFPSSPEICATNISWDFQNDHVDLENCFGKDVNDGFAAGNRATGTLSVTVDLSNENYGDIVQMRQFGGFQPVLIIGDSSGRHREISFSKWIPEVPPKDIPENGTTSIEITGNVFQSTAGARDPFTDSFK